jgi:hypothetical protein
MRAKIVSAKLISISLHGLANRIAPCPEHGRKLHLGRQDIANLERPGSDQFSDRVDHLIDGGTMLKFLDVPGLAHVLPRTCRIPSRLAGTVPPGSTVLKCICGTFFVAEPENARPAEGIVTALHHVFDGRVWTIDDILGHKRKVEDFVLHWAVCESIPMNDSIKLRTGPYCKYTDNWKDTLGGSA